MICGVIINIINLRFHWLRKMLGCNCFYWSKLSDLTKPEFYNLPAPIPTWPQGSGFSCTRISLGEIEVCQITKFEFIWACNTLTNGKQGVSFYKPIRVPEGFFSLGHYCQGNEKPLRGFVLVARESTRKDSLYRSNSKPALLNPLDYLLVWSSHDNNDDNFNGYGYVWLPQPPEGYKALGFLVTNNSEKPQLDEVKCARVDLTDTCEAHGLIVNFQSRLSNLPLLIWRTRPLHRGIYERGVSVGTFFVSSNSSSKEEINIACLKNLDQNLHAMPNIVQIRALIKHYGPTLFFHPDEIYLPSSVEWFFINGAMLYSKDKDKDKDKHKDNSSGEAIDTEGSNLPSGGTNDLKYWIDLPSDKNQRENLVHGNLESAKLYVHVKPAFGGTFTDIVMWVFCPFNGPATIKIGMMNIALKKVGRHVGDWEHFTLRISNFTGELWSIYFSQHSGGEWVDAFDLDYIDGNKAMIYSSRSGHASFPHPGNYLQGSSKLGIGIRNDVARSDYFVDSSEKYEIIASEYLGDGAVKEPCWLQYMREWGPKNVYDSRTELDKIIKVLPVIFRNSVENIFNKLPLELYGEEGPTGPKEKNNWVGDERW